MVGRLRVVKGIVPLLSGSGGLLSESPLGLNASGAVSARRIIGRGVSGRGGRGSSSSSSSSLRYPSPGSESRLSLRFGDGGRMDFGVAGVLQSFEGSSGTMGDLDRPPGAEPCGASNEEIELAILGPPEWSKPGEGVLRS